VGSGPHELQVRWAPHRALLRIVSSKNRIALQKIEKPRQQSGLFLM
jgi:hypothetical protein